MNVQGEVLTDEPETKIMHERDCKWLRCPHDDTFHHAKLKMISS